MDELSMIKVYQQRIYYEEFRDGLEDLLNNGWELVKGPVFFTLRGAPHGMAVLRRKQ